MRLGTGLEFLLATMWRVAVWWCGVVHCYQLLSLLGLCSYDQPLGHAQSLFATHLVLHIGVWGVCMWGVGVGRVLAVGVCVPQAPKHSQPQLCAFV